MLCRPQDAAVAHCWDLPPHTFGGAYAQFMGARGFKADDRPVVRCVFRGGGGLIESCVVCVDVCVVLCII
jgi:hypothetical protein